MALRGAWLYPECGWLWFFAGGGHEKASVDMVPGRGVGGWILGPACRTGLRLAPSWRGRRLYRGRARVLVGSALSVLLVSAVLLPARTGHRRATPDLHPAGAVAPGHAGLLVLLPERPRLLPTGPKLP